MRVRKAQRRADVLCRYADVLVHRCLAAALGLTSLPKGLQDRPRMAEIVDNMNLRHYNAQHAGRSSSQLYTLIFFRDKETFADARVVRVQANGLIVFVPKFGIEGPVYFETQDDDSIGAKMSKTGTVRRYNSAFGYVLGSFQFQRPLCCLQHES
jgi:exoribonuclease R